ncbi:MAG: chemotaxis protein CheD [Myxococcota bacterium]
MTTTVMPVRAEVVVGIADLQVGRPPTKTIVTHALGSCIGVFAWDPQTHAAACLHFMLPKAESSADAGDREPFKYADTGLPKLIRAVAPDKVSASRLRIVACGGATMNGDSAMFRIGQRNIAALRQFAWHFGFVLSAHDLGGNSPRTARIDLTSGRVTVDSGSRSTLL